MWLSIPATVFRKRSLTDRRQCTSTSVQRLSPLTPPTSARCYTLYSRNSFILWYAMISCTCVYSYIVAIANNSNILKLTPVFRHFLRISTHSTIMKRGILVRPETTLVDNLCSTTMGKSPPHDFFAMKLCNLSIDLARTMLMLTRFVLFVWPNGLLWVQTSTTRSPSLSCPMSL